MSACEKCWSDASRIYAGGRGRGESVVEVYLDLLAERRNNPCTEAEQQGDRWASFTPTETQS